MQGRLCEHAEKAAMLAYQQNKPTGNPVGLLVAVKLP